MQAEGLVDGNIPLVDVRSPGEFAKGHIPGAVNLPLFSNEERAEIGTLYKQVGKDAAIMRGLEIVGPKMAGIVKQASEISPSRNLIVHCWRGGMRSGSVAWLLRTAGFTADTLDGGYKAWRRWVLDQFELPRKIVLLGGKTGSGKTALLHAIREKGHPVIDLEALAHHKGSAFGALGQAPQPTAEQFENEIALLLHRIPPDVPVWLEDESHSIGKLYIPEGLWKQMQRAPMVYAEVDSAIRVNRLMEEYGHFSAEELILATEKITRRLGGLEAKAIIDSLLRGDLSTAASALLDYYDKTYQNSLKKREIRPSIFVHIDPQNPEIAAEQLITASERKSNPV